METHAEASEPLEKCDGSPPLQYLTFPSHSPTYLLGERCELSHAVAVGSEGKPRQPTTIWCIFEPISSFTGDIFVDFLSIKVVIRTLI